MKKFATLFAAVAVMATAGAANAALTVNYSTTFQSPTYTDGILNPGTDTTTAGQDGWLGTNGTTNLINVANTATTGTVSLTTSGQDIRRNFTPAITSGSAFLRADLTVTAAQANGDYFLHLGDGGTSNFYARVYARSVTDGYQLAVTTSSLSGTLTTYGATLPLGTPISILAKYDFVAGAANDVATLYVNPTTEDGSGDIAYAAGLTTGVDATTIGSVNLRQGSAANAATVTIDNLAVLSTAVPEPTTLAALAGMGLVAFRRRRA